MKIRIYYEDTDAGGIVYHSNYLKFCERARSEIFFKKEADIFSQERGHFVLSRADCSFLKPAKLGDIVEVKTQILTLKKVSVSLKQEIYKNDEKVFVGVFVLAFVKGAKPTKIEGELRKLFEELI